MRWLEHLSYSQLYYSKWILTLLFAAWFAFMAGYIIQRIFEDRSKRKTTYIVFAVTFLISLLIYAGGAVVGKTYLTYDISRFLAGLIETPAMLAILVAAFMFRKPS
jgi:hypothetical protein